MKWAVIGVTVMMWNYISCEDIRFPTDEETSHVSNHHAAIKNRSPVNAPSECPENMLLYPGGSDKSKGVCGCIPTFLRFPGNNSCYQAYTQGPCAPGNYVVLHKNESVPKCGKNPCTKDGEVPYNGTCYPLRTVGGPCGPNGVLEIIDTTFEIECVPIHIAQFSIIYAPPRPCPIGSRSDGNGICRWQV
ncbi:uncharacterized protein LOC143367949 [Andrena cerasifolii]|uniref:uncharacterized protein LOC143367949 n=1 Tax=Andrena cerasifolii TaxID=2819439 RepID=UPI004037EB94